MLVMLRLRYYVSFILYNVEKKLALMNLNQHIEAIF